MAGTPGICKISDPDVIKPGDVESSPPHVEVNAVVLQDGDPDSGSKDQDSGNGDQEGDQRSVVSNTDERLNPFKKERTPLK